MRILLALLVLLPLYGITQTYDAGVTAPVDSLIRLSREQTAASAFEDALSWAASATALAEACCGTASLSYASACFNEGRVRYFQGDNEAALPWYLKAKTIREQQLDADHYDLSKSYNNLAISYEALSRYEAAEPLYLSALRIRANTHGKESAAYNNALDNLADLYRKMGHYSRAESMGLESMRVREVVLGQQSIDYIRSLVNMGALYYDMNDHHQAALHQTQAIQLLESLGMTDAPEYTAALNNLGTSFQIMGQYSRARDTYQRTLQHTTAQAEPDSSDIIGTWAKMATLDYAEGRLAVAATGLGGVLAYMERNGQTNQLIYAYYKQILGDAQYQTGQYTQTLATLHDVERLFVGRLNYQKEQYRRLLRQLSEAYWAVGQADKAVAYLHALHAAEQQNLQTLRAFMTEQQMLDMADELLVNQKRYLSMALHHPQLAALCTDEALLYKGLLLQSSRQVQQAVADNPALADTYHQYIAYKRRLANIYALPPDEQAPAAALEEAAQRLEKQLVRGSARLAEAWQPADWRTVQAQLQPGEAAVEFVQFPVMRPRLTDTVLYGALLLLPGADAPILLPLCDANQLADVSQYPADNAAQAINNLYQRTTGGGLYAQLWQPMQPTLAAAAVHTVYYAAAGGLHRLNLAAMCHPDGRTLGQHYRLVALNSTRQLANPKQLADARTQAKDAILLGHIQYDPDTAPPDAVATRHGDTRGAAPWAALQPAADRRPWGALPWTEVEIELSADQLRAAGYVTRIWQGAMASEERFKAIGDTVPAPRVLHIATHGYFFSDPDSSEARADGGAFSASADPLIRSGLVLANGNHAWVHGRPHQAGADDGILTAYEVSLMDLSATTLVILSACETGLGDLHDSEGVFGLQRAFRQAGARYLLMTLWQVSDFHTQAFMDAFYQHWLGARKPLPDAFRSAQADMQQRFGDPYLWAGFVLVE